MDNIQTELSRKVITYDDFDINSINKIGGVDISYDNDSDTSCACLVVVDFKTCKLLYSKCKVFKNENEYKPGYLAFKEVPIYIELFNELKLKNPELTPDAILADGNGILHPRGLGLASHLGVLLDIPTVGCAKTLFNLDGVCKEYLQKQRKLQHKESFELIGTSGKIYGVAYQSSNQTTLVPTCYISIGHRISLETAVDIVKKLNVYKTIEPVRQADIISRNYLKNVLKNKIEI